MLSRFLIVGLAIGTLTMPVGAKAADDAAIGAAVVGGIILGAAVASTVPDQHREPLHQYIREERRPSYRYEEEVVVGRELRRGAYESYPVPERYGVPGHHYTIINDRPVIYHPETRRVIHYY